MNLKALFFALVIGTVSSVMIMEDADAKRRLGGGKNSGMQRDGNPPAAAPAAPSAQPAGAASSAAPAQRSAAPAAPAAPASGMSRFMGPIAGILAGTALGALLFGGGLGSMGGIIGMLLMGLVIGGIIFFVLRLLRNRNGGGAQPAYSAPSAGGGSSSSYEPARQEPAAYTPLPAERSANGRIVAPTIGSGLTSDVSANAVAQAEAIPARERIPEGFDEAGFVRDAKASFIKLQAANDDRNVSVLRDFLTPDLYSELAPDIMARDASSQRVDIVRLDGSVLEVVSENAHWIGSIRFSGQIREEAGAEPEDFNEVWHLRKPFGGKWLVAGIQQVV